MIIWQQDVDIICQTRHKLIRTHKQILNHTPVRFRNSDKKIVLAPESRGGSSFKLDRSIDRLSPKMAD